MTDLFDTSKSRMNDKAAGTDSTKSAGPSEGLVRQVQNMQMEEQARKIEHEQKLANGTVGDAVGAGAYNLLYTGIQAPIRSVGQWIDNGDSNRKAENFLTLLPRPEEAPFGSKVYYGQQFGGGLGQFIPYGITLYAMKKTGFSMTAKAEMSALKTETTLLAKALPKLAAIGDAGIAGFGTDFVFRPVEEGEGDYARLKHGGAGAVTLMTMTATSLGLRSITGGMAEKLLGDGMAKAAGRKLYDTTIGAASGAPAGVVAADANSLMFQDRWATWEERGKSAYTMTWTGAALSAAHVVPGQKSPLDWVPHERAKASGNSLAGTLADLEPAKVARAKAAAEALPDAKTGDVSKPVPRMGDRKGTGSAVENLLDAPLAGRAFAAGDKPGEGVGPKAGEPAVKPVDGDIAGSKVDVKLPNEALVPVLQKGAQKAFDASDTAATAQQVADFFTFARGEGAPLRDHLMQVAESYGDPRMVTLVREAYLPPEGVQHKVVDRMKVQIGELSETQMNNWIQFMALAKEMPQDVAGYTKFRHDIFRWLNENPDLQDMARQYGEQNQHSRIAGPLDFYFGTSNLQRFVEVHNGTRPADESPTAIAKRDGTPLPTEEVVADRPPADGDGDGAPKIRLDLTAAQAEAGRAKGDGAPVEESPLSILGGTKDPLHLGPDIDLTTGMPKQVVAERPPNFSAPLPVTKVISVGKRTTEGAPAGLESTIADIAPATAKAPLTAEAARAQKFERLYESFEKGGTPGKAKVDAMMLSEHFGDMTTAQFAKWLDYAYSKTPGATAEGAINLRSMWIPGTEVLASPEVYDAYRYYRTGEGQPPKIELDQVRELLGSPKAQAKELPGWLNEYVDARLAQADIVSGGTKAPHEVLDMALPRWIQDRIQADFVTPGKLGEAPTYSDKLPPDLVRLMEDARLSRPPKRPDGRPERKPFPNDLPFRLDMAKQLMEVKDPVIRERLADLGRQDQMALRTVMGKLNPEKAAPEYQNLLKMVLPNAKNIKDVQVLLDAIFNANKSQRMDRESELTKSNTQLAMAVAEHLVPQTDANFQKTQDLVNDFIMGKIRDPRPEGDFGGRPGGPPGRGGPPRRDFARPPRNDDDGSGGHGKKPMMVAPIRPDEVGTTTTSVLDLTGAKKVVANPDEVQTVPGPERVELPGPERIEVPPVERVETVEREGTGTGGKVVENDAPLQVTTDGGAPKVVADPVTERAPFDVAKLRPLQRIKVGSSEARFIGVDTESGQVIVKTSGKAKEGKDTYLNEKGMRKNKWHQVGTEGDRTIYRDRDGDFFAVKQHDANGFMVKPRPDLQAVDKADIKDNN